MEDEIKRLKQKVNLQIDALREKDSTIEQLQKQVNSLSELNLKLSGEAEEASKKINIQDVQAETFASSESELVSFFSQFSQIIKKIHEAAQFIPYKNATKNSGSFCKVERNVFEAYVNEITSDPQSFIQKCQGFLCIKSENGKCVFNNDKIRVYFVSRQIVNVVLGTSSGAVDAVEDAKVV